MSLTRFNDDDARIEKRLEESQAVGLYQLNAPGPGPQTPFVEDVHIRLQKWGANLRNNTVEMESDFRNMNNRLSKNETRASLPAWTFRDMEVHRWEYPLHDVQKNTEIPFTNNAHTRILEKDNFVRKL
jgi:hypothetical protein